MPEARYFSDIIHVIGTSFDMQRYRLGSLLSLYLRGKEKEVNRRKRKHANIPCISLTLNAQTLFEQSSNSFRAHYRTSCTFAKLTLGVFASISEAIQKKRSRNEVRDDKLWYILPAACHRGRRKPVRDLKEKAAFTLAEVLITLGVIGVVAAMTLPGLVNKYQEKAWLTQFKVTYSVLSQAYLRAYQEHGAIKNWNLPLDNKAESARIVADNLLPYLNLAQDWKQNSNYSSHNLPMHYLGLNGIKIATGFNGWESAHYVFALANGATVGIFDFLLDEVDNKLRVLLYVDTNGGNGPNQFGKDFFIIALNTKKGYPIITGYDPWNSTQNGCSTTKTVAWYSGGACATWVIASGNMDYLHRELTAEEWNQIIKAGDIKEE